MGAIRTANVGGLQVDLLPPDQLLAAFLTYVQGVTTPGPVTDQASWNAHVNTLFATLPATEQTLMRGFFRNAVRIS
jgi:hypothetical protein